MTIRNSSPEASNPHARLAIRMPTLELAQSLFRELMFSVPGEKGIAINLPSHFEITLAEYPRNHDELRDVLGQVQSWLDNSELESLAVDALGASHQLRRASAGNR